MAPRRRQSDRLAAPSATLCRLSSKPREFDVSASALPEFLLARRVPVGQGWFGTPGLVYDGAPGMTVDRIRREAELADYATDLLKEPTAAGSALARLEEIRTVLWSEGRWKWAFVAEPTPMVSAGPAIASRAGTTPTQVLSVLSVLPKILPSLTANFLWPFLVLLLALVFSSWWRFGLAAGGLALVLGLIVEVIAGLGVYGRLRRLEKTDRPDDIPPNNGVVAEIMKRENFGAQNHMAAVSTVKPGPLRRATLRLGLWAAGQIALRFSRPGFLGPTGEIYFARWLLLPGTDKLLFFSNYDGGWESYLEDFIERSSAGVSGIWSNTIGFPRTSALFFGGASDGNRLRRWTRRQQHPTRLWYRAYPSLTQDRIRLNAAIRQGLANAKSEADAEDWLSCFGSSPRAPDSLEIDQIPTLVFGGLRRLAYARCLLVELAEQQADNKSWLRSIEPRISYGNSYVKGGRALEESDSKFALVVGFTRSGLERLGTKCALETFPAAFVHGSAAPWRARPLGDVGANAPETWLWGGPESKIDAIVLMYGRDLPELERLDADQRDALRRHGLLIRRDVTLAPVPQTDPLREPFGFVDGVSDPIIRGVGAWTRPELRNHLVAPGEIVLGYPDGSGMLPCTPTVSASEDPGNVLPAAALFDPDRQRPDFANPNPVGAHNLGFNGTYMVVNA